MVLVGTRTEPRALVGAASSRTLRQLQTTKAGENYQERLWELYEVLGPVHYGVGFKRNAATKVTYFAAELTEPGEDPVPTENPQAMEAFNRLESRFGGFEEIIGELMIHWNVCGEGYLVGQERDGESWDVWSAIEVNMARNGRGSRREDDVLDLEDDDMIIRVWRPSPLRRSVADSPLRSVQVQCEQLLLLNEQIGATAMSRLPAGMLLVPSELSFGTPASEPPDTGANIAGDAFQGELIQVITAAVEDPGSASRVTPMVVRGKSDYIKEVRLLDFARDMDSTFAAMREELLRMIASGLDLPAEILTGLAELNHWSLWGIDESAAKMHVDPDVLGILDSLTRGYLWPSLTAEIPGGSGSMSMEQAKQFVLWRDFADLTSKPVTLDQSLELYKEGVVSAEYVRRVANVPDEDAGDGVSSAKVPVPQPVGPENVVEEPPEVIVASAKIPLTSLADIDRTLADRIIEASEAAFRRALERAGAKIRLAAKKDRAITSNIDGLANHLVTQRLGPRLIEQLQLTGDQLLPADTFDALKERLDALVRQAQEARRQELARVVKKPIEEVPAEEEDRFSAIEFFIAALFGLALQRLFTPEPDLDPAETGEISDSLAPGQLVYSLLTTAGGGGTTETFTPETPRGLALGQRTRASLKDNGFLITSETWRYGFPSREFPGHRALNGITFDSREAPSLRVSPLYSWLGVSHYFPGDHRGCLCQIVPTVEQ